MIERLANKRTVGVRGEVQGIARYAAPRGSLAALLCSARSTGLRAQGSRAVRCAALQKFVFT